MEATGGYERRSAAALRQAGQKVAVVNPTRVRRFAQAVGVMAKKDYEKVVGDAGLISSEVMGKGEIIDFMRLDTSGISRHMIEQTKPFYEKKSFLKKLLG